MGTEKHTKEMYSLMSDFKANTLGNNTQDKNSLLTWYINQNCNVVL